MTLVIFVIAQCRKDDTSVETKATIRSVACQVNNCPVLELRVTAGGKYKVHSPVLLPHKVIHLHTGSLATSQVRVSR